MDRLAKILLVEDEHSLRALVAEFLRGSHYHVVEAQDGPDGVGKFGESGPFHLAILDLNLPGFSGVEVCRRILEIEPRQNVMICSAAIMPDSESALRAMGVDHFLTKPYHPEVLLAHIARVLRPESPPRLSVTPSQPSRA
ncbi:MAG: response regulator with CheY-like receiver domain and winged-helix DNA-binding domain [Planctomycetota bacterium]|nr:response regulator with CheY-like receiver domain and winged-helix DNA-binding domain [Planctomycetota bacterium]